MSLYTETIGYVIHQRNYKDSSLIIEFFSKDLGKIQLIAKGIKKNKQLKTQLQYFNLVKIQFFGKSQLKSLASINVISRFSFINIIEKTAGLYLNELIHFGLAEKSESLYNSYEITLGRLGKQRLSLLLRFFEKELLKYCGFEISKESFHNNAAWLSVDETKGLVETKVAGLRVCTVEELKLFLDNKTLERKTQMNINKLMRQMIDLCLNYRRLYSRELLMDLTSKYK